MSWERRYARYLKISHMHGRTEVGGCQDHDISAPRPCTRRSRTELLVAWGRGYDSQTTGQRLKHTMRPLNQIHSDQKSLSCVTVTFHCSHNYGPSPPVRTWEDYQGDMGWRLGHFVTLLLAWSLFQRGDLLRQIPHREDTYTAQWSVWCLQLTDGETESEKVQELVMLKDLRIQALPTKSVLSVYLGWEGEGGTQTSKSKENTDKSQADLETTSRIVEGGGVSFSYFTICIFKIYR